MRKRNIYSKVEIDDIVKGMRLFLKHIQFKRARKFVDAWEVELLKECYTEAVEFSMTTDTMATQVFVYTYFWHNTTLTFHFNVGYLDYFFKRYQEEDNSYNGVLESEVENRDGGFFLGSIVCEYSEEDLGNKDIEMERKPYIIKFGGPDPFMLVADGNHRLTQAKVENRSNIPVMYFDTVIASLSLLSNLEILVYKMLCDIATIAVFQEELETGKMSMQNLEIFSERPLKREIPSTFQQ